MRKGRKEIRMQGRKCKAESEEGRIGEKDGRWTLKKVGNKELSE